MSKVFKFRDKYRFLSNFWPAPVELDGFCYPTVEHAYQAAKTLDESSRRTIRLSSTPGVAKKLGKQVEIRPDWGETKLSTMLDLLRKKFSIPDLKKLLLDTGDKELIEGNHWGDTFWGVCNEVGENHLGKLLMQVRKELTNA